MARIKLKQKGFENYTGQIGVFDFECGVSSEMSIMDAERFGSSMRCVLMEGDVETTVSPSPLNRIMAGRKVKSVVKSSESGPASKSESQSSDEKADKEPLVYDYTQESLEKLADEGGINALRSVANKYDVRGTSIAVIVKDLIAKKAAAEAENG